MKTIKNSNIVTNQTIKKSSKDIDLSRKLIKKQRLANLKCVICEGSAKGYNFSQISCHSCKEFFRRNALLPKEKIKCINKNNSLSNIQCEIRFNLDRKCQQCRLMKCFQSLGLSADNIQMPTLVDSRYVFDAHLKYTDLLFRYLIEQYSFEIAVNKMIHLVEQIFNIQKVSQYFHQILKNKTNTNQINPLMSSILCL